MMKLFHFGHSASHVAAKRIWRVPARREVSGDHLLLEGELHADAVPKLREGLSHSRRPFQTCGTGYAKF